MSDHKEKENIKDSRKDGLMKRNHLDLSYSFDPVKVEVSPEQKSEAPADPRLGEKKGRVPLPPRHWTLGPHEQVTQTADPSEMMENLEEILEGLNVDFKPTGEFELNCLYYPNAAEESFRVSFYMTPRGIVLEVWRLYGDLLSFRDVYHRLIDAAVEKKLVVPRDPTKFNVREDPTLSKEWKRMEKKWNDARTEEEISNALKPFICMAGSPYIRFSSGAVQTLCLMSKNDHKVVSWLVKNGHVADAQNLAESECKALHLLAVSWIANMTENKEFCESLATPGVLKILALRLGSACKQVVREASRALKNLGVVLGPKKILSAAKISDETVQKMIESPDPRTKAVWQVLLGN